jgi:hypothetical protein
MHYCINPTERRTGCLSVPSINISFDQVYTLLASGWPMPHQSGRTFRA